MIHKPIYGILLAGGQSSRMGTNKALLPIDGVPLIERIAADMADFCEHIVVVAKEKETYAFLLTHPKLPISIVTDIYPGKGPLAGIHAGLNAIPSDRYAFVLACDMPQLAPSLLRKMLHATQATPERPMGPDAVLCVGQPFHALYHARVAPTLENFLQEDQLKVNAWLHILRLQYIEPTSQEEDQAFSNLNTPEDYAAYLKHRSFHTDKPL
jgi:molybdopterin-guanine dinucleotide biosynthesis protein A